MRLWPRRVGVCLLVWLVVVAAHALAGYSDQLRRGGRSALAEIAADHALAYLPWFLFSLVLLRSFERRRGQLGRPSFVARRLIFFALVYLVPQVAYQVAYSMFTSGIPPSEFADRFVRWPAVYWLVDIGLFGLTFAVVYAFEVHRETRLDAARRIRLEADNSKLRLAALRGQLEPHFLFNSLNAISGLVRANDRGLALSALQQLSSLLRYALEASSRERVQVAEELAFVREYARLQQMRYGDRLRLKIGRGFENEALLAEECPPFLLQPLIENAIRHDLECHDGVTEIELELFRENDELVLEVGNSRLPEAAPNPGSGLGLSQIRDRLFLLFGAAARLGARASEDPGEGRRFLVKVSWPAEWPAESDVETPT